MLLKDRKNANLDHLDACPTEWQVDRIRRHDGLTPGWRRKREIAHTIYEIMA